MIKEQERERNERVILRLLENTEREGMDKLISYLKEGGFFTSPASTRFHSAYPGGLAKHSLRVCELLSGFNDDNNFSGNGPGQITQPITKNNLTIACLLHDVCKMGAYVMISPGNPPHYKWDRDYPAGHAVLSISRIQQFIKLELLELLLIKFHMGVYGLKEFEERSGEYNLRGDDTKSKGEKYGISLANAWYHNPIVKFMYFCDEIATLEEKSETEAENEDPSS